MTDMEQENRRWQIALFAGLAERLNTRSLTLDIEASALTVGELKELLKQRFPEHADLISISFMACNQAFAGDDRTVSASDELALLPPVSGGEESGAEEEAPALAERFAIRMEKLDPDEALALVSHPDHGAALVFVGTTREWTAGKRTVHLEYEAYVPMALSEMRRIGREIGERWPGTLCAIHHRIGSVAVGEASVVIAVSSPHRAQSYEASRYAIERLKQTVPIWKKEVYEDGSEWKGHQSGPWNPLASPEHTGEAGN
jgi:molybdopterin synthase catalytic subunit